MSNALNTATKYLNHSLLMEAANEAIQFALRDVGGYGLAFLDCWKNGEWLCIEDEYPEFDLTSDAQQYLMDNS